MMNKLFFVALLAAAFAAEDPLIGMVEEVAQKISLATQKTEKSIEEHVNMASEAEAWLREQCGEGSAGVRKAVRETIAKGIEKNKTLEAFGCIASRAREGLEKIEAIEGEIRREMKNILEKAKKKLMAFQQSTKNFSDYLGDLYMKKLEEMHKPGSNMDKILKDTKKKLDSLKSKLKDIDKKLKASKAGLKNEINRYGYIIYFTIKKVQNDQSAMIKKCVR